MHIVIKAQCECCGREVTISKDEVKKFRAMKCPICGFGGNGSWRPSKESKVWTQARS